VDPLRGFRARTSTRAVARWDRIGIGPADPGALVVAEPFVRASLALPVRSRTLTVVPWSIRHRLLLTRKFLQPKPIADPRWNP
jgi:hypothetical protein